MFRIRKAAERGHADFGWLDSRHTFSFGSYQDPAHMGLGPLRVINEDRVMPGAGFGTHAHRDMEIISYVLDGALEHKDSIGTGSVLRPGDIQRMTAGTGIEHSEFNHSKTEPVHFLQIWIVPAQRGLEPGYQQISVADSDLQNQLRLVAGPQGGPDVVTIHQDVRLYAGKLAEGVRSTHAIDAGRGVWIQVARGSIDVNGRSLEQGDGVAITDIPAVDISVRQQAEVLLFDLPINA